MSPSRIIAMGEHYVSTQGTVRLTAKAFGISKSAVHKLLTQELPGINPELAQKVRTVIKVNKKERHLRGGFATKKVYDERRKQKIKNI